MCRVDPLRRNTLNLPKVVHPNTAGLFHYRVAALEVDPKRRGIEKTMVQGSAGVVVCSQGRGVTDIEIRAAVPVMIPRNVVDSKRPLSIALGNLAIDVAAAIRASISRQQQNGFAVSVHGRNAKVGQSMRFRLALGPELRMDVGENAVQHYRILTHTNYAGQYAMYQTQ